MCFSNDKSLANRLLFVQYLERVQYFFTREEKMEMAIVISRMIKDNEVELVEMVEMLEFKEKEELRQYIQEGSKSLR